MAESHMVIPGFSLLNRALLYVSILLAPAQNVSGIGNNCPSNLGFLAYNWYTQIAWFRAAQRDQMHALTIAIPHFNLIYAFSYIGGISSGNRIMGLALGLGTAGVLILNTATAWIGWRFNQVEGFGEYKFFFFGWRTLSGGWHKFLLYFQVLDTITATVHVILAIYFSVSIPSMSEDDDDDDESPWKKWFRTLFSIPVGAAAMLLFAWPLILWTELIMARNYIVSETDYVAVWLFVAQVGAMVIPPCSAYLSCFRGD